MNGEVGWVCECRSLYAGVTKDVAGVPNEVMCLSGQSPGQGAFSLVTGWALCVHTASCWMVGVRVPRLLVTGWMVQKLSLTVLGRQCCAGVVRAGTIL